MIYDYLSLLGDSVGFAVRSFESLTLAIDAGAVILAALFALLVVHFIIRPLNSGSSDQVSPRGSRGSSRRSR